MRDVKFDVPAERAWHALTVMTGKEGAYLFGGFKPLEGSSGECVNRSLENIALPFS